MARYTPYKGRRRGRAIVGVIVGLLLVGLAVVLVLAATHQIVFTPDGPTLDSKVSPAPAASQTPSHAPTAEPNFIIEQASPSPTAEPTPEPTPESSRPAKLTAVQFDPRDDVAFNGAVQLAKDGLINAVVLELGEKNGALHWRSAVELANTIGSVPEAGAAVFDLSRISQLHDAGLYVIARISSFKESYLGNYDKEYAVKWADGRRWLDGDRPKSLGWLDPYSEVSRGYVADLTLELIRGGADEVLLDNFSFPTSGYVESIAFAGEASQSRTAVLDGFFAELSEKAEAAGGRISVSVGPDIVNNYIGYGREIPAGMAPPAGAQVYSAAADESAGEVVTVALGVNYTDPAASAVIAQLLSEHTGGVVLVSADGRYPASW